MNTPAPMLILGGGPAGLAAGYYARKRGRPFAILEAGPRVGGNCVTIRHGAFRCDSGAHRLHDKDPETTAELRTLLGDELQRVNVPSLIFHGGRYVEFPLSPLNLLAALGIARFATAALEVVRGRLAARTAAPDFESFAVQTYGRTIADRFLLNYSAKLWGLPCRQLSTCVSGTRMRGLTLKTFLKEAVLGKRAKTEHLDGAFFYPRNGIGAIPDALAAACGIENIRLHSPVTRVFHDGTRITAVEVSGRERIAAGSVLSTLPLDGVLRMMSPAPPADVQSLADGLRYRNVVLVALFLNRPSVTDAATLYFPEAVFPFTRLYEPRNRSASMSPPGQTSLVIEVPCQAEDAIWSQPDAQVVARIVPPLFKVAIIAERDVIGSAVTRMPRAYPLLELGFEARLEKVMAFLGAFGNLSLSGRCGRFAYVHLHHLMQWGRQIVSDGGAA